MLREIEAEQSRRLFSARLIAIMKKHVYSVALVVVSLALGYWWGRSSAPINASPGAAPAQVNPSSGSKESSIAEVLELANQSLKKMETDLHDYSARFVKQELDTSGVLSEQTEINVRIQTRMRNDSNDAPMRVYLKFASPEAVAGREVLWGKDLYDGQMAVHETGMILGLATLWLQPTGIVAMTGQRYPIYEIGLVRLVEQLIERGQQDIDNPDVKVTITPGYKIDDVVADLIQVRRGKPSGNEDDFKLAEVVFDRERMLILSYRSFGWPEDASAEVPDSDLPLLESYTYHDIKTNTGMTDKDFDVKNSEYGFP